MLDSFQNQTPLKSTASSQENGAGLTEDGSFWQEILSDIPWGIAAVDAATGATVWINATLQKMLHESAEQSETEGHKPPDYLPGLTAEAWERAHKHFLEDNPAAKAANRLQFVHKTTRSITYWEWRLQAAASGRYLLLVVQNVSDSVMNERMLAGAGRTAALARKRAETLMRLSRMVSESSTLPALFQAVVRETAAYFETSYAAVLLHDGTAFRIGHSIGLAGAEANADFLRDPQDTLAIRALKQRQVLAAGNTAKTDLHLPALENGKRPSAVVAAPIQQGETSYGVVAIYFDAPRIVPPEEMNLLGSLADQIGTALQKADLNAQVAGQRRQLQSIFDNAPVNIIAFDTDLRVTAMNRSASEHYWAKEESPLGRYYNEILHDVPPEIFPKAREGDPYHESRYLYRLATGRDGICDVSVLPLRDDAGQVVGLLLLSFEVTELVKAQQAAEHALADVQAAQSQMVQMEKMRAVGELASGVAHDLNNALMAILGYTELSAETLDDRETLATYLRVIEKAASDASSTVRRLQNFARQRTASLGEPTNVNQVIEDVIEMTRPRWRDEAQKQGRRYRVETKLSPLPSILAEASGLREALLNMIHNALDAMPEGGSLTFSTRLRQLPDSDKEEVEIEIADTGRGMTAEVAARIFDPFFTTRGVEGTGLGLAVSWTILQRHGGNITVDSTPGEGTRFVLHLPVTQEAPPALAEVKPAQSFAPGVPVLVVDDEPFVASIVTSILTRRGHTVTTADSAKRALELLREPGADFRLLVTDHGMPGMTGLELVAEMRRNGPKIPSVMLTGWGQSLRQNHAENEMPEALLGKPIHQADLLEAVERVLKNEKSETGGER